MSYLAPLHWRKSRSLAAGIWSAVAVMLFGPLTIIASQPTRIWANPPGLVAEKPAAEPYVETDLGYMTPYTEQIPGSDIEFEMVPVPGGVVTLPANEDGESFQVKLEPFWIGRKEVTWGEYQEYMSLDRRFAELERLRRLSEDEQAPARAMLQGLGPLWKSITAQPTTVDGVTAPTPLYDPSTTYVSGKGLDLPAVTMTPFAAKQYTKWLSAGAGAESRLPSEAEWKLAAAAGSDTAYGFGDDASELEAYAWFTDNSDYTAHPVGQKKPNSLGLYDMIGNAAELVLDQQTVEGRPDLVGKTVGWEEAVTWPEKPGAIVAKGGFWDSYSEEATLDARLLTNDPEWKLSDPNRPLSPWWFADYPASGVGIRVVRPLRPMSEEIKEKVWYAVPRYTVEDIEARLKEGRGKLGPLGPEISEAIRQLREQRVRDLLD